ncbi:enoyl-CoA hydratase [Gemmobacter caeni]|jgi:enoyl-CoA hydratase|uniref:3-hydroxyisobutyryl-CoA hydrolase n=2 Tax=Gemmobacter TaxID=204456 RepID=A0A2T6B3F2_9RHOB|nr:enoyl-CoA hydratase [Gemmobacter caeni]TWI94662.1 enoyl-CoA hydratase [Gemmobacter caeni]
MPVPDPFQPAVLIRREGRAGRITLNRPARLNALTREMCLAILAALDAWRADPAVALVIFDAAGDRAFSAGGDVVAVVRAAQAGDFTFGRDFFSDEYRMNALIALYPKPIIAFMQGYTMGGGIGIGGHASHRILGETTQMAMPETRIGLVPDVGASALLARSPGRTGLYLGLTGARMTPGDAIYCGFADLLLPQADWPGLIEWLAESGDPAVLPKGRAPDSDLAGARPQIDRIFARPGLRAISAAAAQETGPIPEAIRTALAHHDPLAMAATLQLIAAAETTHSVPEALEREFRFTARAAESGDFIEGVRAMLIDRDDRPAWRQAGATDSALSGAVAAMLAPL